MGFYWAVAMMSVILFWIVPKEDFFSAVNQGVECGHHITLLLQGMNTPLIMAVVTVASPLPYSTMFVDEQEYGFSRIYLPRGNFVSYICGKVIAPAVSGFCVPLFAILLVWLVLALMYAPHEEVGSLTPYIGQLVRVIVCYGLSGGLWASFGAVSANISQSKYTAYITPFVAYYVLIMVCDRYLTWLYVLDPREWLNPASMWPWGNVGTGLWVLLLLLCCGLINYCVIERRIR